MRLTTMTCPTCDTRFVIDTGLYEIGTVRVRCTGCAHYFLPPGSPRSRTVEDVANSAVPLTIFEPADADLQSGRGSPPAPERTEP